MAAHWNHSRVGGLSFPRGQRGFTTLGRLFIVILIGLVAMTVIRLVPVYVEYFAVRSAVGSLSEAGPVSTARELQEALNKRLDVNRVSHVDKGDIAITREGLVYHLVVDYEVRVPFISNIDFVVSFRDEAEVKRP